MESLKHLEPKIVWNHFDEICKIPRPSQQEAQMREYILQFAKKMGLASRQDQAGNVVVRKPATSGKQQSPIVILQSHMDMVGEKDEGVNHDFNKDALQVYVKDDYVYARGTTLGADNGIGLAVALAILESKELVHGPLECLFTVDEETGLNGAKNLVPDLLQGRIMINLDSEEDGIVYIGCAGGGGTDLRLPLAWQTCPAGYQTVKLTMHGLQGGHSGGDIHLGRGNALELLVRILDELGRGFSFLMHQIYGGDKHNAIPRAAYALVAVNSHDQEKLVAQAKKLAERLRDEFGKIEPEMEFVWEKSGTLPKVLTTACQERLLAMLRSLPHGVMAMNPDIVGLVNTSTNFAKIEWSEAECLVHCSSRSALKDALEATRLKIEALGKLAGAAVKHHESYPGWKPDINSQILQKTKAAYAEVYQQDPEVKAIHAGLECGILGERIPGMDMVSIGPQIENPHSPKERVQISSVAKFWKVMTQLLRKAAG